MLTPSLRLYTAQCMLPRPCNQHRSICNHHIRLPFLLPAFSLPSSLLLSLLPPSQACSRPPILPPSLSPARLPSLPACRPPSFPPSIAPSFPAALLCPSLEKLPPLHSQPANAHVSRGNHHLARGARGDRGRGTIDKKGWARNRGRHRGKEATG